MFRSPKKKLILAIFHSVSLSGLMPMQKSCKIVQCNTVVQHSTVTETLLVTLQIHSSKRPQEGNPSNSRNLRYTTLITQCGHNIPPKITWSHLLLRNKETWPSNWPNSYERNIWVISYTPVCEHNFIWLCFLCLIDRTLVNTILIRGVFRILS